MSLIMQYTEKGTATLRVRQCSEGQRMCVMVGGRINGRQTKTHIDPRLLDKKEA
jgi:hypothetical protein